MTVRASAPPASAAEDRWPPGGVSLTLPRRQGILGPSLLGVFVSWPSSARRWRPTTRAARPRQRHRAAAVGRALARHHPDRSRTCCPSCSPAARPTMLVALVAGVVATVLVGASSAWPPGTSAGWRDDLLSMLANVFLVLPGAAAADRASSASSARTSARTTSLIGLDHRRHRLGLRRAGAAGADAVAAQPGLRGRRRGSSASAAGGSSAFEILPNLIADHRDRRSCSP